MPAPPWENLGDFLNTDEFAVSASIALQGGGTRAGIAGIFDEPYLNAELGEFDLDTSRPRFLCAESAVAGVQRYDTVTLTQRDASGAVTWSKVFDVVTDPQPTGDGMATLELSEP